MRKATFIAFLIMVAGIAHANFAIFQTSQALLQGGGSNLRAQNVFGSPTSVQPGSYYIPGTGSPAISTADYYHLDGLYGMRPYDLLNADCGAAGAAIAASRGRYVWVTSADHPVGVFNWLDGQDFRLGYSNDPGVLPATMDTFIPAVNIASNYTDQVGGVATGSISGSTLTVTSVSSGAVGSSTLVTGVGVTPNTIVSNYNGVQSGAGLTGQYALSQSSTVGSETLTFTQNNYGIYQFPGLVCNPDDATFPFYVYAEGQTTGGFTPLAHENGVVRSADLVAFTTAMPTHINPTFTNWSSFQRVVRDGTNSWHSTGLKAGGGFSYFLPAYFTQGKWTSTNGLDWVPTNTAVNQCAPIVSSPNGGYPCPSNSSTFYQLNTPDKVIVGSQAFQPSIEDTNASINPRPMYLARAPIDTDFNILTSPAVARVSSAYSGYFPGPSFMQNAGGYVESGVAHYYVTHGFFVSSSNFGLVNGSTFAQGGGLWQQNIDYYTEITDATAAVNAAPIGVTASCSGGVATLAWHNALPNNTYRVYRGTSVGSQPTNLGAATAPTFSNTPGSTNQFFYKVVTLNAGVEAGNRIVNVYCTAANARVNAHINRVLNDGGDITKIDQTWLAAVDNWLAVTCDCLANLRLWTNPAFGVKLSGSDVVKVYDYGTTTLPRGGDLTFCATPACAIAASTTYSATGLNSTTPAWVNGAANSRAYYGNGRLNNIRRQVQVTAVAAFSSSGDCYLMATGEFGGMALGRVSGNASFLLSDDVQTKTATVAVAGSTAKIIGGTFDGTSLFAWSEGVAGTAQTGLHANTDLSLATTLRGLWGISTNVPFLQSGSLNSRYTYGTGYIFSDASSCGAVSDMILLDGALSGAQMLSLAGPSGLLRTRIGP